MQEQMSNVHELMRSMLHIKDCECDKHASPAGLVIVMLIIILTSKIVLDVPGSGNWKAKCL